MMRPASLAAAVLVGLVVAACGLLPKADETAGWSAQKLYSEAKEALTDGDYERAIGYYEKLEARYPFGKYAQQAMLEIAYAYYKDEEPDSAIAAADRFIRTYPRHPNVDYAYYLKGLANFNRGKGIVEKYLPQDPTERDPGAALQSFEDFSELVRRFPHSKYAADAAQRMRFLRNNLAAYEVNVAEYYLRRGAYLAAANRVSHVIEQYQRTPAVPDALVVMAEAYKMLRLDKLSQDALRVLRLNFPNHPGIAQVEGLVVKK
jgi:outer membrane protein assembly factor BamD